LDGGIDPRRLLVEEQEDAGDHVAAGELEEPE
jgi:hypothetical protein